jgi:hypothetical protein
MNKIERFNDSKSSESSESSESFDFSLYNTLKGIWNSKEYIPRRKKLAEPLPDYQMFREDLSALKERKPIHFEECIRKPPIFIIDRLSSIKEWIKEHVAYFPDDKQIFVYVKKNINFCKEENKNVKKKKDINIDRSFRNFSNLKIDEWRNINPLDVLNYKYLVIDNPAEITKFLEAKMK